jgi:hypothetical protein
VNICVRPATAWRGVQGVPDFCETKRTDWVRAARGGTADCRSVKTYSRHDFVQGEWPAELKRGVQEQAQRFESCLVEFARQAFGRAGPAQVRRATFVLAEVPVVAVKTHLQRGEPPPPLVDELIRTTYHAIVGTAPLREAMKDAETDR